MTWKKGNISISHPSHWIEFDLGAGKLVTFLAPKESENDHYPDEFSFAVYPNSQNSKLTQLKDFFISNVTQNNFKLISSEILKENGREYLKAIFDQGEIRMVAYEFVQGENIYLLTLNIERANYEKFLSIGDKAFQSLKVE